MNVVTVVGHSLGPKTNFSYCRSIFPKTLFLRTKLHFSHKILKIPGIVFKNIIISLYCTFTNDVFFVNF